MLLLLALHHHSAFSLWFKISALQPSSPTVSSNRKTKNCDYSIAATATEFMLNGEMAVATKRIVLRKMTMMKKKKRMEWCNRRHARHSFKILIHNPISLLLQHIQKRLRFLFASSFFALARSFLICSSAECIKIYCHIINIYRERRRNRVRCH